MSYSVNKISFIFLMIPINSTNDQNICVDLFKACVHYFLSTFYFSPNDSPSKIMKNVFYFI